MEYAKITLSNKKENVDESDDENVESSERITVDVFLPEGSFGNYSLPRYYTASRFEHGSMIGNIRYKGHVFYTTDLWRMPHNRNWPESGMGLASEFGVGDQGDFCIYRCGWPSVEGITNGVLGYKQATNGQPFLKIGVGALLKGTCPDCDSTDDYMFNSPYLFAETPKWTWTQHSEQSITLNHEASLQQQSSPRNMYHGYQLQKDISLVGNVLSVTTSLTNTGAQPFSTVWYSHNLFNCDGLSVGPGYAIELNLTGTPGQNLYEEPGTWSWATPLARYARIIEQARSNVDASNHDNREGSVRVEMTRSLDPGIKIKAEFNKDDRTQGGFVLKACDTRIANTLYSHDGATTIAKPLTMYAYSLYVERGTFSPEPQILLHLDPGMTRRWTQRLEISELDPSLSNHQKQRQRQQESTPNNINSNNHDNDKNGGWMNLIAASLATPPLSSSSATTAKSSSSFSSTPPASTTTTFMSLTSSASSLSSSSTAHTNTTTTTVPTSSFFSLLGVLTLITLSLWFPYQRFWSPTALKRRHYTRISNNNDDEDEKDPPHPHDDDNNNDDVDNEFVLPKQGGRLEV